MKIIQESKLNINDIVAALENGAVLVLPTDTVYGLVCDATNEKAVEKIFKIKKRDKSKTLLVFVNNIERAEEIANINEDQDKFLSENWPGQVTAVLNAKGCFLSPLVYKNDTIGIRVPDYKLLNVIIDKFEKPLAQTSANISDQPFPVNINDVIKVFEDSEVKPDLLIDAGDLPKNKPSVIMDLTKDKIEIIRK